MLTHERKQQINSIEPMYRALYYVQKVFTSRFQQERFYEPITRIQGKHIDECGKGTTDSYTGGYLSLRSVKDLTEEDILKLRELTDDHSSTREEIELALKYIINGHQDVPYPFYFTLLSFGIALPYYTATTGLITVEEFIEAGILVITPNQPQA